MTSASKMASGVAIDLALPCPDWSAALPGVAARCRRAARAALAAGAPAIVEAASSGAELSLVLGDDALLHRLNKAWRGKDAPTNVLSFPAQAIVSGQRSASPAGPPLPLGDVILAYETIRREADEQGKTLGDHLTHLVVHGVLHLLGFDHETASEAETMEAVERRVLAGLGIADPYQVPDVATAALMEPSHG